MRRVCLLFTLLLIPPAVYAQGLGDAAAHERQKREKETGKKPPRSYTNADLRKEEPKKDGANAAQAAAEDAAQREAVRARDERVIESERTSEDNPSSSQSGEGRVAQAQAQLDSAQSAIDGIEGRIRDLRDKLNPMSGAFIYGPGGSGMANEEQQVRQDLKDADAQLADARKALADATQALQDARQGRPTERPQ